MILNQSFGQTVSFFLDIMIAPAVNIITYIAVLSQNVHIGSAACNVISHFKPIDQYCPKCGWFLVEKYDKKNGTYKSCINPDCDYLHSAGDSEEKQE